MLQEERDEIKSETAAVVDEVLEQVDQQEPYTLARSAAETLDNAAAEITELEQLLVEYHGRPIYTGSCKYLDEASIE
jgi:hypothetical protein